MDQWQPQNVLNSVKFAVLAARGDILALIKSQDGDFIQDAGISVREFKCIA